MLTIHLYCDNVILHYIRTEFILKIALQSFVYWFGIFIACKKNICSLVNILVIQEPINLNLPYKK